MLDIYSPSGKEEDIQLYLEELLKGAGFALERQEVEEDRFNLRSDHGGGGAGALLVGHVDTMLGLGLEEFGPGRREGMSAAWEAPT